MPSQRRRTAGLLIVPLLAGCQGGVEPGPTKSPDAQPSAPTSSTTPSDPQQAAATGPQLETENVTFRLPEGWRVRDETKAQTFSFEARKMAGHLISTVDVDSLGSSDLDDLAKIGLQGYDVDEPPPERRPDLTVDGVEGYHIEGKTGDGYVFEYGTVHDGNRVDIEMRIYLPPAKAQALADSVMATWRWK